MTCDTFDEDDMQPGEPTDRYLFLHMAINYIFIKRVQRAESATVHPGPTGAVPSGAPTGPSVTSGSDISALNRLLANPKALAIDYFKDVNTVSH